MSAGDYALPAAAYALFAPYRGSDILSTGADAVSA